MNGSTECPYAPIDWMGSYVGCCPAGSSKTYVVYSIGAGNEDNGGAFQSLTGYYIGWDGDRTIAVNKKYLADPLAQFWHYYNSDNLEAIPAEHTCAISGFINYAHPQGLRPTIHSRRD